MSELNFKQKYLELRAKYMEAVDTAFRLGYEQGALQGAQDQMAAQQQQQQEQEAQLQQQAGGAVNNPPGQEQMGQPNAQGQISENPDGTEFDQHIAELENMVNKSEVSKEDLLKSFGSALQGMKNFKEKISFNNEMRKSYQAIPAIAKALHKPAFKMGQQASHNMNSNAKQAVTLQHKIVEDVMKSWNEEQQKAGNDISKIIVNEVK